MAVTDVFLTHSHTHYRSTNLGQKKVSVNFLCLLFCLVMASSFGFTQDCELITLESITDPGTYSVATLTEADGIRNGPDYFGATIYYPENGTPPFASIALVPGFTGTPLSIEEWGPFYASHGIVAIIIGTNFLLDLSEARAIALLDALETIRQENTRASSPLEGALNLNQLAVSGHSMGGGGAQLAAVSDPSIQAVVALCPWLGVPTVPADINHPVPVLILSAELDAVAPPVFHADVHYNYTPDTTEKLLFEIANAGHQVANSPTGGQNNVGKIALSWLKKYLLDEICYCPLLLEAPSTASTYITNIVCATCPSDLNGNGVVEIQDLLIFTSLFGVNCSDCPADINNDGTVEITDFIELQVAYGSICP
jgi:dienelactone hydrolase